MGSNQMLVKVGLSIIALCIAGYILVPPLYWHFIEGLAAVRHSSSSSFTCAPCVCDCSSEPILIIPGGLSNASFGVDDPSPSEEHGRVT